MNWISSTGLRPRAAMPTHNPLIRSSARGVSTRSAPMRFTAAKEGSFAVAVPSAVRYCIMPSHLPMQCPYPW